MQLTLEADYAVRIVYVLSGDLSEEKKRMDAKNISEISGVPLRFSLKILRKLVGGGLVRSYKGTRGGYELAKEPSEISLLEVVELIEGRIRINRCVSGEFICTRTKDRPCEFQKCFNEVSEEIRGSLNEYTFDRFMG